MSPRPYRAPLRSASPTAPHQRTCTHRSEVIKYSNITLYISSGGTFQMVGLLLKMQTKRWATVKGLVYFLTQNKNSSAVLIAIANSLFIRGEAKANVT